MSRKLLTIAIPTYNRSELLDSQLRWLNQDIRGLEDFCEIIISNNDSTDDTDSVLQKWKPQFKLADFKVNDNPENIGAIRNIALCIQMATAKHVWVMSDDDRIFPSTLLKVVRILRESENLGLLFLNYTTHNIHTGMRKTVGFRLDDKEAVDGKVLFEEIFELKHGWGALIFTTALVYRTDLAQQAIREWEVGVKNLMFQLYITAFCALNGSMRIAKDTYLEYAHGRSFFVKKKYFIKLHYVDKARVYIKMMKMGYSPRLCKRNMYSLFRDPKEWVLAVKLLLKRPFLTSLSIIRGLFLMVQSMTIESSH